VVVLNSDKGSCKERQRTPKVNMERDRFRKLKEWERVITEGNHTSADSHTGAAARGAVLVNRENNSLNESPNKQLVNHLEHRKNSLRVFVDSKMSNPESDSLKYSPVSECSSQPRTYSSKLKST